MKTGFKIVGMAMVLAGVSYVLYHLTLGHTLGVLAPQGRVAKEELTLIIISTVLMLTVVLPVVGMTLGFAWKYRASNTSSIYRPNWSNNTALEIIWWVIPILIICILGAITWASSHDLDPYRTLESNNTPITIQVVALNWKWLFIYPQEGIATVNYADIPIDTPITFQITADAPMNSFWIPQLAGQIYAMPGMQTQLNILADTIGEYHGASANFSGEGFSDMKFLVHAVSKSDYDTWVSVMQLSNNSLSSQKYFTELFPNSVMTTRAYSSIAPNLYTTIMSKYMLPQNTKQSIDGIHMQ